MISIMLLVISTCIFSLAAEKMQDRKGILGLWIITALISVVGMPYSLLGKAIK